MNKGSYGREIKTIYFAHNPNVQQALNVYLEQVRPLHDPLFSLFLSVLTRFTVIEYTKLEQIDFGTTVYTSFNEFQPIHISALSVHYFKEVLTLQEQPLCLFAPLSQRFEKLADDWLLRF